MKQLGISEIEELLVFFNLGQQTTFFNYLSIFIKELIDVNNTNWSINYNDGCIQFFCGNRCFININGDTIELQNIEKTPICLKNTDIDYFANYIDNLKLVGIKYLKESNLAYENKKYHLSSFIELINERCDASLSNPQYNHEIWRVPCNLETFDAESAFAELKVIDWKQSIKVDDNIRLKKINVNDIIYIYASQPKQALIFKCIVRKTKIPFTDAIDDSKYIKNPDKLGECDYYFRLEPLIKLSGDAYSLEHLKHAEFIVSQGPCKLHEETIKYLSLIENLQSTDELIPEKYDASYIFINELIKCYSKLEDLSVCDANDINLIYLSVIGTWSAGIDAKKSRIKHSHLLEVDKEKLLSKLDALWVQNEKGEFIHCKEQGKSAIGMFGTGCMSIQINSYDSQKFIKLCVDLLNKDEEEALKLCETTLEQGISGFAAPSISFILHCLKPSYFPIVNRQKDNETIYAKLGIQISNIISEKEYIANVKNIREYRDSNFKWKNYRIIDLLNTFSNDLQVIYEKGLKNRKDIFEDWYNSYSNAASTFVDCIENNSWSNDAIELLIQTKNNGITGLNRKNFDNLEIQAIKNDWHKKIEPLIKKLVNNQLLVEDYNNLINMLNSYTSEYKIAAYNRVIAGVLPGKVTTLIRNKYFNELLSYMQENFYDYPVPTYDWFCDNKKFIDYCNSKINFNKKWHVSVFAKYLYDEFSAQKEKDDEMENLIKEVKIAKNIIFTGAPGTGKTYLAQEIAKEMDAEYVITQFHPSYDYTDFIEGLRPTKNTSDGNILFKRMDGEFKNFCKAALEDQDTPYVFIIDEINRGEVAKIFGELFYALDIGYRGKPNCKVNTQYQNLITDPEDPYIEGFYVPSNVYIIGTMNDIDRSVESIDFAFRRRFTWKEITAEDSIAMLYNPDAWKDYGTQPSIEIIEDLKTRLIDLNKAISDKGFDSCYHIGASYLLRFANYFKAYGSIDSALEGLWKNHLQSLLYEYLRGTTSHTKDYLIDFENAFLKNN